MEKRGASRLKRNVAGKEDKDNLVLPDINDPKNTKSAS
jgi:hypothetical protein